MPLWNKHTIFYVAVLASAPFAPEVFSQTDRPLKSLPLPPLSEFVAPPVPEIGEQLQDAMGMVRAAAAPQQPLVNPIQALKPIHAVDAPVVRLAKRPAAARVNLPLPTITPPPQPPVAQSSPNQPLGLPPIVQRIEVPSTIPKTLNSSSMAQSKPNSVVGRRMLIPLTPLVPLTPITPMEPAAPTTTAPVASVTAKTSVKPVTPLAPLAPLALTAPAPVKRNIAPNEPSQLLAPVKTVATSKTAVGVTNDFPLAASTPSVVVRSPFVQPGNPNRYLFVVENIGTVDAQNTRVDLRVPAGVVLKQVVADSAASTARHAVVRIGELKPGAKSILEVEVNPTNELVKFDTSVTLETKRSFSHVVYHPDALSSPTNSAPIATPTYSPDAIADLATGLPRAPATTGQVTVDPAINPVQSARPTDVATSSPVSTEAGTLSSALEGPVLMSPGETGVFSIVVRNPNFVAGENIVVQLSTPPGLKVTTLDRDAWVDDDTNTISWEIQSLGARQTETIQYKAVGKSIGQQAQRVFIGMDETYQGEAKLLTLISP